MKKIYLSILLVLTILSFSCEKKTEEQIKIDELLDKYETAISETKKVVENLKDVQEDDLNFESFSELLGLASKINEIEKVLENINIDEFTEKQKERFEKLSQTLKTVLDEGEFDDE
ncbi:MAG: hypothetical protein P1P64_03125 [Treponemataceae bacterium]